MADILLRVYMHLLDPILTEFWHQNHCNVIENFTIEIDET